MALGTWGHSHSAEQLQAVWAALIAKGAADMLLLHRHKLAAPWFPFSSGGRPSAEAGKNSFCS